MRGILKNEYRLLKVNDKTYTIEDTTSTITLPALLSRQDFLIGIEGYIIWSVKKQCLVFPKEIVKYTGKIILKNAGTVQS